MLEEPHSNAASPQAATIPSEWQPKDHFDLRIAWLVRDTPERAQARARELAGLLGEALDDSDLAPPFPGWDMLYNVAMESAGTLDGALAIARKIIKNSDFRPGSLNPFLENPHPSAPVKPVKGQRLELIAKLEKPRENPDDENGFLRTVIVEISDEYALWAAIEHLELPEEMSACFESAANPLRSLVGRTCTVSLLDSAADNDQEVGLGTLSIRGREVQVGGWSHVFAPDDEVTGIPYETAAVESAETGDTLAFEVTQEEPARL